MSAAPESSRAPELRVVRRIPDLRAPHGLDEVERTMLRLTGERDLAGEMCRAHLATGGKRLRARLALGAASALDARRSDAIAWAAAVELLHNATLVHDDIQDGDTTRRGHPTLWASFGTAQAINAGDMLLMLPFVAIAEAAPEIRGALCTILAEHAVHTVRGQTLELDMSARGVFDGETYRTAITGKTGAILALAIRGAAIAAGRSGRRAALLAGAFMPLGSLFQLQDDVLDLYGDKGRGSVGSDLYEGKVSALCVAHVERMPGDREELLALLRTPRDETPPAAVSGWIDRFVHSGALGAVLAEIAELAQRVASAPALRQEPALWTLALDLTRLATSPIQHLFPRQRSRP